MNGEPHWHSPSVLDASTMPSATNERDGRTRCSRPYFLGKLPPTVKEKARGAWFIHWSSSPLFRLRARAGPVAQPGQPELDGGVAGLWGGGGPAGSPSARADLAGGGPAQAQGGSGEVLAG